MQETGGGDIYLWQGGCCFPLEEKEVSISSDSYVDNSLLIEELAPEHAETRKNAPEN